MDLSSPLLNWMFHLMSTEYPTDAQQRPRFRVGVDSTAPNQVGYWTVDLNNLKPWKNSSVAMLLSQVCASQLSDLVELVRGELSKLARRTLTASRPGAKGTAWNPRDDRDDLFFNAQRVQVTDGTSTLKWFHSMTQLNAVLHLGLRLRISRHRKPIRLRAHFCVNTISKAMVTIDVHNRDVVGSLRDAKITSTKDSLKFEFYPLHGWYGLIWARIRRPSPKRNRY